MEKVTFGYPIYYISNPITKVFSFGSKNKNSNVEHQCCKSTGQYFCRMYLGSFLPIRSRLKVLFWHFPLTQLLLH
jgi:hypothetical protein